MILFGSETALAIRGDDIAMPFSGRPERGQARVDHPRRLARVSGGDCRKTVSHPHSLENHLAVPDVELVDRRCRSLNIIFAGAEDDGDGVAHR